MCLGLEHSDSVNCSFSKYAEELTGESTAFGQEDEQFSNKDSNRWVWHNLLLEDDLGFIQQSEHDLGLK